MAHSSLPHVHCSPCCPWPLPCWPSWRSSALPAGWTPRHPTPRPWPILQDGEQLRAAGRRGYVDEDQSEGLRARPGVHPSALQNDGYTLKSIEVEATIALNATQRGKVRAELWTAASGADPASKVRTWRSRRPAGWARWPSRRRTTPCWRPTTVLPGGVHTDNTVLRMQTTTAGAEDSGAVDGWAIADAGRTKEGNDPAAGSWVAGFVSGGATGRCRSRSTPPLGPALHADQQYRADDVCDRHVHRSVRAHRPRARPAFTTSDARWVLSGIEVESAAVLNATAARTVKAEVWSTQFDGAARNPHTKLYDLEVPSTIPAGTVEFTAPPDTLLSENTIFALVVYTDGAATCGCKSQNRMRGQRRSRSMEHLRHRQDNRYRYAGGRELDRGKEWGGPEDPPQTA